MTDWQRILASSVNDVEQHFDRLKYRLQQRMRGEQPYSIIPYSGHGTQTRLILRGRVLRGHLQLLSQENDSLWRNLLNTYRRLESDEVPYARVQATFEGYTQTVQANDEGYFNVDLQLDHLLPTDRIWYPVELRLLEPEPAGEPITATGRVLVPPAAARFGVISDLDDTVLQSHATQLLRMARTLFLGNARTRLPFPGVAAFYRALQAGTAGSPLNPLFYVSSSPWNLYELFLEFFELQDIPHAPIFLRDWGITENELLPTRHAGHKLAIIRQLFELYPDLPFILIGDSGQEDPEIYHQVVHDFPQRVLAVYVRDVTRDQRRSDAVLALMEEVITAGSTLILAEDTMTMARHAATQGWIEPASLPAIEVEKQVDESTAADIPLDELESE